MKRATFRTAMIVTALSATTLAGGCAVISYTVATLAPKPRAKALYELPPGRRALVFPDDVSGQLSYPPLKDLLADKVGAELLGDKLVASTVDPSKLRALAEQVGPRWRRMDRTGMGVAEATRALGADLAIYLSIREFRLKDTPADPSWKGKLTVLVKVVDADGRRLWPVDRTDGYELTVQTPVAMGNGPGFGIELTHVIADRLAVKAADLFRAHPAE